MRRGPTSSPPSRSTRPKTTTWRTTACSATGVRDEARERLVADRLMILVILEQRAERRLHMLDVELLAAEGRQRAHPVDRLGEPGRLLQVERAQLGCETGRLGCEPLGHARHAQLHDLDLARNRRMVDPVVEAAALERV